MGESWPDSQAVALEFGLFDRRGISRRQDRASWKSLSGDLLAMKITSEIFQVGGGHLTSPEDAAIYLIKFGQESVLVDA